MEVERGVSRRIQVGRERALGKRVNFHVYVYGDGGGPIGSSFEEAAARLVGIERLYFEPDGSFVWSGPALGEQLDGMVYDAAGRIRYVDLQGSCSLGRWRGVLEAICPRLSEVAAVMRIPEGTWNDLQTFEEVTFGET